MCLCLHGKKDFTRLGEDGGAVLIHVTDTGAQNLHLNEDRKTRLPRRARRAGAFFEVKQVQKHGNALETLKQLCTKKGKIL